MKEINKDIIVLLGPTASGKTSLAVQLADEISGEIISVDSRQVYTGMNIGTGKDLNEFSLQNKRIPYHLIDIKNAGEKYNLFDFKKDCLSAIKKIEQRKNKAILCGGTGMYLDAILLNYDLPEVKLDQQYRNSLNTLSDEELISILQGLKTLHNVTDTLDRQRLIRAIEVAKAEKESANKTQSIMQYRNVFGLRGERSLIKERIEKRLKQRFEEGMIEEVEALLEGGLSSEDLNYYGLEYKFINLHIQGELSYNDMYQKLRTGIFQFSKRQMTWFRRMEKKGIVINWLDIENGNEKNLSIMMDKLDFNI